MRVSYKWAAADDAPRRLPARTSAATASLALAGFHGTLSHGLELGLGLPYYYEYYYYYSG